jgi:hypothetical protein
LFARRDRSSASQHNWKTLSYLTIQQSIQDIRFSRSAEEESKKKKLKKKERGEPNLFVVLFLGEEKGVGTRGDNL